MHLFPEILFVIPALPIVIGSYTFSSNVHIFVNRVLGKKVIAIEGTSRSIKGDKWKSPLYVKDDKVIAYRYPQHKIGEVILNADGTGNYCGDIEWKEI